MRVVPVDIKPVLVDLIEPFKYSKLDVEAVAEFIIKEFEARKYIVVREEA